jgi:hypothetical protein
MPSTKTHSNIEDNWISTNRGQFHYDDPSTIDWEDISRSLSRIPRYYGHTDGFYSVAQHSVACAELAKVRGLSTETQFVALMHDAAEAYCGDMTRPLKERLPKYNEIIESVEANIAQYFGFQYPMPDVIEKLDVEVYWYERRGISSHPDIDVSDVPEPPYDVAQTLSSYWSPEKSRREFRSRYKHLQR